MDVFQVVASIAGTVAIVYGIVKTWREARSASADVQLRAVQAAADEWRELKDSYKADADASRADADANRDRLDRAESRIQALEEDQARERRHSMAQDQILASVRRVVHTWAEWGQRLQDEWATIRLREAPPDLPRVEPIEDGPLRQENTT